MNFRPIETAPIYDGPSVAGKDQILCRFWYPYLVPHWVYFVARANGKDTKKDGYDFPTEWCELPQ